MADGEQQLPILDGRYRLVEELGRGSAATVYKARDFQLDRDVAIKLLTGTGAVANVARLQEEARVLGALRHPNILELYGFGTHQGAPYLVTELIGGGSLAGRTGEQALSLESVASVSEAVLEALAAAHEAGVLHRDVKPGNVLLTSAGEPRLADFGLAKSGTSQVRTASGLLIGTPAFMGPELFAGKPSTAATDLFAWGILVYYLINGRVPFPVSLRDGAAAKAAGQFEPGREAGVLRAAIHQALRPNPADRGSAGSLLAILRQQGGLRRSDTTRTLEVTDLEESPATKQLHKGSGGSARTPRTAKSLSLGPVALAVGLLVLVLIGASLPSGPVSPPPTSEPAPRLANEREILLQRWTTQLEGVETRSLIREAHRYVLATTMMMGAFGPMHYPDLMNATTMEQRSDADLAVLERLRRELPHRVEFRRDGDRVLAAMGDSQVSLAVRSALAVALRPLLHIDVYYRSWGMPPPYGAEAVHKAFLPVERTEPVSSWTPARPLPTSGSLRPGRYALFRWPQETADWPVLFGLPEEGPPSTYEQTGLDKYPKESHGRFVREEHEGIEVRLDFGTLEPDPAQRYSVVIQAGGLFIANTLELSWDEFRSFYYPDSRRQGHLMWDNQAIPEYLIRFSLPPQALGPGAHMFRLRVRPLPGLDRFGAISMDHAELWVEARTREPATPKGLNP